MERKVKDTFKVNRSDWSGREVEVTVFQDDSFSFDGNRFWMSREKDVVSGDHIYILSKEEREELETMAAVMGENLDDDYHDEFSEEDLPLYVYGDGWEYSICSIIKIGSEWTATVYGGEMTREDKDPMVAAIQLLCNIV